MNLNYHYWYFTSVLSKKFCNDVLKLAKTKQNNIALTGNLKKGDILSKNDLSKIKKLRNSNVVWLDEPWIYKEIHPFINLANQNAGWNFQWDWSEPCQFTKYSKEQFYTWHRDSSETPFNDQNKLNFIGKIRKLSVTISLSDPKDYKGGELEFDLRNDENGKPVIIKCKEILPKGSIVVFPSFVWHRVTPVTKGTRYSLVMWNLGYPFK